MFRCGNLNPLTRWFDASGGIRGIAKHEADGPWVFLERSASGRVADHEDALKIGLATPRRKRIVATGGAALIERSL
jgi:hypothetical protein